ncbi:MAG: prolyl oligopeptidase family serine peptidase [Mariniphaga sp.]
MKQLIMIIVAMALQISCTRQEDSYLWLEEVDSEQSLEWVNQMNQLSLAAFTAHPDYQNLYETNLRILNSDDRIPFPSLYGDFVYNFWQDQQHERGIWRRATRQSYLAGDPDWQLLLDIDELSRTEGVKWVFKGATGLYPEFQKFLVSLSKGGGDAVVVREFDIPSRSFVDSGFYLPEAKGGVSWIDENTLMVATDFGDGVTTSGYPRQVKSWRRGTALAQATEVFSGEEKDMGIWGYTIHTPGKVYQLVSRRTSFYEGEYYFLENGELIKPELPGDIELYDVFNGRVIFQLKSDWTVDDRLLTQGTVISMAYTDLISGKQNVEVVVQPGERESITEIAQTRDRLLINMLVNVKNELHAYHYENGWVKEKMDAPEMGSISLGACDEFSNAFFFDFQNFLEPSTLFYGDAETGKSEKIRALSPWFPTEKYEVKQFQAVSADGTSIPYFVVHAKNVVYDGKNPTLLYAYGGFEVPMLPRYSAVTGAAWLEKGGVYVLANLRGGGEFGPSWHQAGLKENRQRIYDDFHAVAENLITKKITSSSKLGIYGGSNGGLLVGVAFTQRPDLYQAVVCAVPLLDMKRYNKLLAGASWMAEYGNPDIPEEWAFIQKYSPYHNLNKNRNYPEVFFTTSTRDDRVHPGHARKMAAKMNDMGYKTLYYENTEGGHAGASTNEQRARMNAQVYTYLQMKLMDN